MKIEYCKDSKTALRIMTEHLTQLMQEKGLEPFNLALSGGETAKQIFSLWVEEYKDKIDWNALRFFWVDERCVPASDSDSNYGQANRLLFKPLHIPEEHIHRIKGEKEPGAEAMRYSWEVKEYLPLFNLMPTFDCIILGIGNDAHTASIFPNTMELLSDSRSYTVSQHPASHQFRITMTGTLILNNSPLLIPVFGEDKKAVIEHLADRFSPSNDTPAAYILSHAVDATVYTTE
ncbi:6-phosphogluconolactonase [Parabacteroides provencensis]|uniref:6-phosphogluconolactonase n=1 Tax=Parabacteroides provencensis TaxID=1944636 RepID=UPI000C156195|nr:6-phosphogluconolactonase [Parabacteroides provencensis]